MRRILISCIILFISCAASGEVKTAYDQCYRWADVVMEYYRFDEEQRDQVYENVSKAQAGMYRLYLVNSYVRRLEDRNTRLTHSAALHECLKERGAEKT